MRSTRFGLRHGQLTVVVASAMSVVAVVAVVALVVQPWRDTAARTPAAPAIGSATLSASALASPPAVSVSGLAASSAPMSALTATDTPSAPPSPTPTASRRTSPTTSRVAADGPLDFKVSTQVSPTKVVLGQYARVTVTVVNQGAAIGRQVVMSVGGSDPSDNFSGAQPPCTDATGAISCEIDGARTGQKWSFTFNFVPGPFPGVDGYVDPIGVVFDYTNSHGQPQQTPQYFANVQLFNAPASSPPPASGPPSNTPSASVPTASATSTS